MTKFKFIMIAALGFNFCSLGLLFGQDNDKESWKEFGERMEQFGQELSAQIQESLANIDMTEVNEAMEQAQEALQNVHMNMNDMVINMDSHGPMSQMDINKTFKVSKGGELSVNIASGDINVTAWDKDEVSVTATFFDDEEGEGLDIKQNGNNISIEHQNSWGSTADLEIKIPSNFNLELNTTSGDIHVTGAIIGAVTAQTMGGDISTGNVSGKIQIQTSGGDIRIGDVKGENALNTMGGDIRVGNVTDNVLEVQTMGGDITVISASNGLKAKTYGGDIKAETVKGKAEVVTYGGDIKIKNLNGDGDLDTKGGDIEVEKGAGKVSAKTAGGDISFDYLEGSLRAKTASGDIYAALIPSGSGENYINASHGSVTLAFPDNAKATVNVSVRLRGWGFDDDEDSETGITSDFQEVSSSADNDNKDIKKTFSVNGGGPEVKVDVTNSDVNIKKYTGPREKGKNRK